MANLIRLKQIESGSALTTAANVGSSLTASINDIVASALTGSVLTASINIAVSQSINTSLSSSITNIVSASLNGALSIIATDVEVAAVSASIAATDSAISSSISSSNYNLSSSVNISLGLLSASIQNVTGDFSSSVAQTFATQSLNLTSVSSSLNAFTSSIGLTIKQKLNTENVITSSRQLDNSIINNLTIGSTGDNYSLIVSGALAVVDTDITISGSQYNVAGQIFVNGLTGSAGNPPTEPYDNSGNPQSDMIDQGEW